MEEVRKTLTANPLLSHRMPNICMRDKISYPRPILNTKISMRTLITTKSKVTPSLRNFTCPLGKWAQVILRALEAHHMPLTNLHLLPSLTTIFRWNKHLTKSATMILIKDIASSTKLKRERLKLARNRVREALSAHITYQIRNSMEVKTEA